MRIYRAADEERIHIQREVRGWTKAGLLADAQGASLEASLRTELRRTHVMLRAVLAFFTLVITGATLGLIFVTLNVNSEGASALLLGVAAGGCLAGAEATVTQLRLYRYGIEEALACAGVVMAAISVGVLSSMAHVPHPQNAGLVVAAAGAVWVYHRFGFAYAPIAAMACAAAIPFQLALGNRVQRLAAVALLLGAFGVARAMRRQHAGKYREADFEIAQAAAWAGAYLVINVHLSDPILIGLRTVTERGWFYWATFVAVWLMPVSSAVLALRERNRPLLDVSIVLALLTIATNKAYLGIAHQSWDPMLLGVVLAALAIGLRRWLAAGPGGERAGFTPARILDADRELLQTVANVSAGFRPHTPPPPVERPAPGFGGARSGGAGASGSF